MTHQFDLAEVCAATGFWYVGTPYTDYPLGLEAAARNAALVTGLLMRQGVEAYSPIAHYHCVAVHAGIDPKDGKLWMQLTASVRRLSCGLIVVEMQGWRSSRGLIAERGEFLREGKPVYYLDRVALKRLIADLKR